jgi:predicted short-subunit dehydrogenase-like oxidoreductase (DUF2520 family)
MPGVPVRPVHEAVAGVDLVLLAVPDDVLQLLSAGLAATGAVAAGTLVVHTSGRFGTEVLQPLIEFGVEPIALHPVMTFTGTSVDVARLSGCPFGVTAEVGLRPVAEALVVELGGEPVWVPQGARPAYHAAIAFAANNVMTLVSQASDILRGSGIDDPAALLAPLLAAAVDNALRAGDAAATGPVVRGDTQTISAHLSALADRDPIVLAAYRTMAKLTAHRAAAAGLITPDVLARVRAALEA